MGATLIGVKESYWDDFTLEIQDELNKLNQDVFIVQDKYVMDVF